MLSLFLDLFLEVFTNVRMIACLRKKPNRVGQEEQRDVGGG
jgi:hypothetical protein